MKNPIIHPLKINFEIPVSEKIKLPRFVYIFIIEGEKLHLIDTGVAPAYEEIKQFIKTLGRDISEIQNIFLTHSHPDHIGTAKLFQESAGCKIFAPANEIDWIKDINIQFQQRPVPGFHELVSGSVKEIFPVQNNQELNLEKHLTLASVSTPGHSAGSTSFFLKERNALFCGDAILLPGEIPIFENVKLYFNSLENIKNLNPDILYSSWDKPRFSTEIVPIIEKSKSYILTIQETAKKVAKNFENPDSIDFCVAVLKALNQNEKLANPLLLKSFLACL